MQALTNPKNFAYDYNNFKSAQQFCFNHYQY